VYWGCIFPVVLENLSPKIGFAWSTGVIGLVTLILLSGRPCQFPAQGSIAVSEGLLAGFVYSQESGSGIDDSGCFLY
jgi:hypothetical protein